MRAKNTDKPSLLRLTVRIPLHWAVTLDLLAGRRGVPPERVAEELLSRELELRRCRICGCTDAEACPEGCSWVEEDLCSECAAPAPAPKVRAPKKKPAPKKRAR